MKELFDAVKLGNLEEVKRLIDENKDKPDLINCELNESRRVTPLFEAIRFGRSAIVQYLYELGAKLPRDRNPLELAAMYGHDNIFEFFISKENNFDIEAKIDTNKRKTLLQIAASHTNPYVIKWLLAQGPNVDVQEDEVKCTALHIIAFVFSNKNLDARETCIEYLLDANADVSIKMARNQTVYDIAIEYKYGYFFQQLYFNRLITSLDKNKGEVTKQARDIISELVDKSIKISELPGLFKAFKEKHPNISFQYQRQAQGLIYHALWEKQEKSQKRLLKIAGWMALSLVLLPVALVLLGVWGWKKTHAQVKATEVAVDTYQDMKEKVYKGTDKEIPKTPNALELLNKQNSLRKACLFPQEPAKDSKILPANYHGVVSGIQEALSVPNQMLVIGTRKQIQRLESKLKFYRENIKP